MNREKAIQIDNEIQNLIEGWAKEHGYTLRRNRGSFDSTSTTASFTFIETASDGLPKMSDWDQGVMQNHLRDTPWAGKDPRGHVFKSMHKRKPRTIKIENFKYGNYPWKCLDLESGKHIDYTTNFINWNEEV